MKNKPGDSHTLFNLSALFSQIEADGRIVFESHTLGRRLEMEVNGLSLLLDNFTEGIDSLFIRVGTELAKPVYFSLESGCKLTECPAGGWLLVPGGNDMYYYWLPVKPLFRIVDDQGHILSELPAHPREWGFYCHLSFAIFSLPSGYGMDLTVWRLGGNSQQWVKELSDCLTLENQGIFLWGSHARLENMANVFTHLIHGAVYDVRWAWPNRWKCCSENEAHALYTALNGLEKATSKKLYRILQRQLVISLIMRQSEDGGWYHGIWTKDMECHYRLHSSGIHMFLDEYSRCPDPVLREALESAAAFLARQTDKIDSHVWFLHDSLEKSPESMNSGPFGWLPSKVLGKSLSNMLVLNTHLDSIIALNRYQEITGDKQYEQILTSACEAVNKVMFLRTAEWLYRPLFWAICLTFIPTLEAQKLPLPIRAVKRIAWKYLIPLFPYLKIRFPRLVMPGGYIDRELSLKVWAVDYQGINIMDLIRFQRHFPKENLYPIIHEALNFTYKKGLSMRWKELKNKEYALGFWIEALYHFCTLSDKAYYRNWLAEAILDQEDLQLGIPPSLLGANSDAVPITEQTPCPSPVNPHLRVANLSHAHTIEILVVNPTTDTIPLKWEKNDIPVLTWTSNNGTVPAQVTLPDVPARGWLLGQIK